MCEPHLHQPSRHHNSFGWTSYSRESSWPRRPDRSHPRRTSRRLQKCHRPDRRKGRSPIDHGAAWAPTQPRGQTPLPQECSCLTNSCHSQYGTTAQQLGCCQICGTQGNSAKQCSQLKSYQSPRQQKVSPFMPWNPRANLTVPASYNTTNWLMDRGSTHHIMSDLESLSFHQPYDGATYLWVNPFFHSRIKHVALDYQFIRNQVKSCTLRVVHVSTEDQLADAMTKPLPYPTFISFAGKIGVCKPLHFEGTY